MDTEMVEATPIASRQSKRSEGISFFGNGTPNPVHHLAQPFFSNLEVMDYKVGRKMNAMVKRADKTNV